MREITLKTANRPTTVSRAKVRKAVQEVYSPITENETSSNLIPQVDVVITNRTPSKVNKG